MYFFLATLKIAYIFTISKPVVEEVADKAAKQTAMKQKQKWEENDTYCKGYILVKRKEPFFERDNISMEEIEAMINSQELRKKGSTITGGATIALSSDIDFETTKLWHMRLGHMSEKGMDMLSKQGLLGSKRNMNAGFCEHCVFGKQYRMKFSWGPSTVPYKGDGRYMLTLLMTSQERFLISRDLTFDESSMLSKKVESTDAGKDHRVKKKVELKVRAPDSLPKILTDEEDGSHPTDENEEPQEQQYNC
ncbi:hypothetical protein RJ639_022739 [Escallonia herrerae]|uniref:GAG-pre-integrase domain-containing protein n=1 Tax=Escallonia herrerae TaxID=1293975 RepID=A0AA89AEX7_9ASTE|nr:hypothetical protein RJ639_022739 [Escallonia herrerae]